MLLVLCSQLGAADKLDVKIVARQDNASVYSYVVPGYSQTNTNANANCAAYPNSVACQGSATSTTSSRPTIAGSYQVSGATFTLELPDGRRAVVNCNAKTNWTLGLRRSCRVPVVNEIKAEFSGADAKLFWSVSLDGKKFQSETYKIVAIIAKPQGGKD
jgi:hypothetical protein